MIDKSSIRRLVENEAIFREYNEKVQQSLVELDELAASEGFDTLKVDELVLQFYCECSDENCRLRILFNVDRYAGIHKNRQHFIVVPGHEIAAIEKVVIKKANYYVVEKLTAVPEQPQKLNKTAIKNV